MNCTHCGAPLPQGADFCPTCGTTTSAYYSSAGAAPDAATALSTPDGVPVPLPSTDYGRPPYGAAPPSPYNVLPATPYDPYSTPPLAPPPPSPTRRGNRIGLLILAVLLAVIVVGGGVVVLLRPGTPASSTLSPAQVTATAQAHAIVSEVAATQTAVAQATVQANAMATATVVAQQNLYTQITQGAPVLSDPMSGQDNNGWDQASDCTFMGGAYHASVVIQGDYTTCNASSANFRNFAFQVQMVIIKGDSGGICFRSDSAENNLYYFIVYQDGSYALRFLKNGNVDGALIGGLSTAFKKGLGQTNSIAVVAQDSTFFLYINGQFVARASDTTFVSGEIGVVANDDTHPTDVAFSNAKVWQA